MTADLKRRRDQGQIELVYFPVDPESRTRYIQPTAVPSNMQWRDANVTWGELQSRDVTWVDLAGSEHFEEILRIIGPNGRRDALHVDSAFKSGCVAIVIVDSFSTNEPRLRPY